MTYSTPETLPAEAGFESGIFRSRGERLTTRPTKRERQDRQTETDRQTDREQTDRQTDTKRQKERQKQRERLPTLPAAVVQQPQTSSNWKHYLHNVVVAGSFLFSFFSFFKLGRRGGVSNSVNLQCISLFTNFPGEWRVINISYRSHSAETKSSFFPHFWF